MQKLDSVVGGTEANVMLAMNTQLAISAAIMSSRPVDGRIPFSEIQKQIEKNRPHLETAMKSQIILTHLYTYQSLTNSELEKYIEFAGSEAGTKTHKTALSGLNKAMIDAGIRLGDAVGELFENTNKKLET